MSTVETDLSLLELVTRVPPSRTLNIRGFLSNAGILPIKARLGEMQTAEGEVLINIDSMGGHVRAGISMYETFRTSSQHVRIIGKVENLAASASFMALQGCHIRVATPNSTLLIHDTGTEDPKPFVVRHDSDIGDFLQHAVRRFPEVLAEARANHEAIIKILLARSVFTSREELEKFLDEERRLTPEEAIRYGFLDGVI